MNITISAFTIEIYDGVLALWQKVEGVGLSSADSREGIRSYLERNPGMSFVALKGGQVVGAVLAGHDGRRGYIHHLAVHPDHRRRSLGRRLVDRCLTVLADAGIQKCHLFIFNENTAGIEFWKSMGWVYRSDISVISKTIEPRHGQWHKQ
jgi:putative acetyltransferase